MAHEVVQTRFGAWRLAPLRPLDEFLLESARFQWPNIQIAGKWSNRVRKNLLYYQSNYFLTAAILFLCVSCIRPNVWLGIAALGSCYWAYSLIRGTWTPNLREDYPMVHKALILFTVYFTFKLSANIASLIFAVSLPVALVLAHASFRLRNLNNKLSNLDKSSKIITPMQSLLDVFDMMVQVTRDRSTWAALSYRNDRQLRPKHKTSGKEH